MRCIVRSSAGLPSCAASVVRASKDSEAELSFRAPSIRTFFFSPSGGDEDVTP